MCSLIRNTILVLSLVLISTSSLANKVKQKENNMSASGTFEVNLEPQKDEDTPAGRMIIKKEYTGDLIGQGIGQMISKRTEGGVAVYAAIEEFNGTVKGKKGSFTFFHNGFMSSTKQLLDIKIVEGSGSGELQGISGTLSITQENDRHQYEFNYEL